MDGWRNASVNPCVRAAAQCQVSACEWACVTAVSARPSGPGRWEVGMEGAASEHDSRRSEFVYKYERSASVVVASKQRREENRDEEDDDEGGGVGRVALNVSFSTCWPVRLSVCHQGASVS